MDSRLLKRAVWVIGSGIPTILMVGCSLVLDFDPKSDAGPAPTDDASLADSRIGPDATTPCDLLEPNDDISEPSIIVAGTYGPLAICPESDHDFFRFTLGAESDLIIEAQFDNNGGAGDLEMRLYDSLGAVTSQSTGFEDNERIEHSLAVGNQLAEGDYIVEIYGFSENVQNEYTLVLTL